MNTSLAVVLTTGLILVPAQAEKEPVANDKEKLQGIWVLTAGTVNGEDKTAEWVKIPYKAIIKGDKITLGGGKEVRTSPFVIDSSSKPKSIDILVSLGIYEVKDDVLKICFGGRKRPTDFTSKSGSERVLFVFKRTKSTTEGGK